MSTLEHKEETAPLSENTVNQSIESTSETAPEVDTPKVTISEPVVSSNDSTTPVEATLSEKSQVETVENAAELTDQPKKEPVSELATGAKDYTSLLRKELVAELKELLKKEALDVRNEIEIVKQAFYKKLKEENESKGNLIEELSDDDTETESEESTSQHIPDEVELEFKALMAKYREAKAEANAALEAQREKNYLLKMDILTKLEELTNSTDDLSETIPAFRKLQQEWKTIGQIPQTKVNELWKAYSHYQEKFYDLIKINNDLREYDFKKNLEIKTEICEATERLKDETDAVKAFQILQKFHEEWRETGPVARELREEIWNRFKEASSVINKKHQAYFESLKEVEEANLLAKAALCEKIEQIAIPELKSFKQWDAKSAEVIAIQAEWREIGHATPKTNAKIFRRFRAACDAFFKAKNQYYKEVKDELSANLDKKKALCEQAEALKDSTDWTATAEKFIEMQKEWKTIGATPRKYSDAVWKRFVEACDYFFELREKNAPSKRTIEQENLKQKRNIIDQINSFVLSGETASDMESLKALVEAYNQIGFVPFRDKDRVYREFKAASDQQFDLIRGGRTSKRGGDNSGTTRTGGNLERSKLLRQHDTLKNEITTYENNIGFLTASSKKGSSLVDQMNQKVEKLKIELEEIIAKIDALDQQ